MTRSKPSFSFDKPLKNGRNLKEKKKLMQ